MNESNILLEKSRQYAGKPAQLEAFYDGLRVGNELRNPDIKMAAQWMDEAKARAASVIADAKTEVSHLRNMAQDATARERAATVKMEVDARERIEGEIKRVSEIEANPKIYAAKQLMADLLEQAGYATRRGGSVKEVPSAVLCHIATMVAAVAGENPVSIVFGAKETAK